MAIFTPGAVVGSISGKLGGSVFVQAKKQAVVRFRPPPRLTPSQRQGDSKARFVNIQQSWRGLTSANKLAWRNAARATLNTNRLGKSSPPGGFQYFVQVNAELRNTTSNLLLAPPIGTKTRPPASISPSFTGAGLFATVVTGLEPLIEATILLSGWTQCTTVGTRAHRSFRFLAAGTGTGVIFDVTDEWDTVWGTPTVNQVFTLSAQQSRAGELLSDPIIVEGAFAA